MKSDFNDQKIISGLRVWYDFKTSKAADLQERRSSSNQSGDVQIKNQDVNRRLEKLKDTWLIHSRKQNHDRNQSVVIL